jgi:hypothetical protein
MMEVVGFGGNGWTVVRTRKSKGELATYDLERAESLHSSQTVVLYTMGWLTKKDEVAKKCP